MPETVIDTEVLESRDGDGDLSGWANRKRWEAFFNDHKWTIAALAIGGAIWWLRRRGDR